MRAQSRKVVALGTILGMMSLFPSLVLAQYHTNHPTVPSPYYRKQGDMDFLSTALPNGGLRAAFFDIFVEVDSPISGPPGGQLPDPGFAVDSFFDITYRIDFLDGANNPIGSMQGPGRTAVMRRNMSDPGHPETKLFDTEMLSMDLQGSLGGQQVMIRESPTLPSLGKSRLADLGGGNWQIDSFFDVFTELSIDGGQSWIPGRGDGPGGSTRLGTMPEPATLATLGIGLVALLRKRRARR